MKTHPVDIGGVIVPNNVFCAPLAGYTDFAFRKLCYSYGAGLCFTEMVSAKGLRYKNEATRALLHRHPSEKQTAVQLFGSDPQIMRAACESEALHDFPIVDINMGCPARKIAGKGDGSALMRDPLLASRIIGSVSNAISCPLTVKFRRGYEEGNETAVEFARMAEESGAAAIAVHGRYAQQFYRGKADWDIVARVKRSVSIPVIGNGDVADGDSAIALLGATGCDAIMVGRGAQGNPWVFRDIASKIAGGPGYAGPTPAEKMALATRHAKLLSERSGKNIVRMRKHAMWYVAGMKDAAAVRRQINDAVTYDDFASIFEEARRHTEEEG